MAVSRAMVVYGAWMISLATVYLAVPSMRNATTAALGLSASAAIVWGVRRYRPPRARAWYLLVAALLLSSAGRIVYDLLPGPFGSPKPYLWVVTALQFAAGTVAVMGLLGLSRVPGRRRVGVIDVAILLLGVGLLFGVLIAVPAALTPGLTGVQVASRVTYVLRDALLLVTTLVFVSWVRWTRPVLLLATGALGLVAQDVLFRCGWAFGEWFGGVPTRLGWLLFMGTFGAAALSPAMVRLATSSGMARRSSMFRLSLVTSASLLPSVLLLALSFQTTNFWFEPLLATGAMAMLVLVLARMIGAALQLRLVAAERVLRDAVSGLAGATNSAAVAAVLEAAVPKLLRQRAGHSVLVADGGTGAPRSGVDATQAGQLLPAASLPGTITQRLGSGGHVVSYALGSDGTAAVTPEDLTLYVRSDRATVAQARPRLEVLASQARLALDRMRLTDEIIRTANEQYFSTLVRNAADVILMVDDHDLIAFASPSACAIFGRRSLRGVWLPELVDESQRPAALQLLARTRAGEALYPGKALLPGDLAPAKRGVPDAPLGPPGDTDEPPEWVNLAEWTVRRGDGSPVPVEVACRRVFGDSSIHGLVVDLRDVSERHRLERELAESVLRDPLTGLLTRPALRERARQAVAAAAGTGAVVGLLGVDLDDFKMVNDRVGYDVGDVVLKVIAQRLTETLPPGATASRGGGDTFAVLIEDAADATAVDVVASSVTAAVARPIHVRGHVVACTASVGIATTAEASSVDDLGRRADLALHAAKDVGKGQIRHYHPSMRSAIMDRLELRSSLDRALDDGSLRLEYQPIIALDTGRTAGFEALLRWQHPTRGRLYPGEFVDIAEESGLIVEIGDWVLATATREARRWAQESPPNGLPFIGINVSARQLRAPGFVENVRRHLAATGLASSRLYLEITESLLLRDDDREWDELQRLRALGVRVAIDDFGTGYSALSYLRHVPLDVIKLDRLFISTTAGSARQRELVEGIVRIANVLRLNVVAEGIETDAERRLAVEVGCSLGQGFLFSGALSGDDATRWLTTERVGVPVERPGVVPAVGGGRS